MLKKISTILFVTLCLFCTISYGVCEKDPCKGVNMDTLKKHLPSVPEQGLKIVSKRPINSLCEVLLNFKGRIFPLYVGKGFIISGNMFSYKNNITQQSFKKIIQQEEKRRAEEFKKLKKEIDKVIAFSYSPTPSPAKEIYMFTDPLCPFSHKAEKKIKEIVKKYNTKLNVVFFPVHLPKGKELAIESICKGMNLDSYIKDGWRKENPEKFQCEKGKKILNRSLELGKKLSINGVPTFILSNGTRIVGVDLKKIERVLSK